MNRFGTIPAVLYSVPSLVSIIITDNQVADVDAASLRKLSNLNCLDLTNNSIARVPPELGLLPACKSLKLEGNCFKIPRPVYLYIIAVHIYMCVCVHDLVDNSWFLRGVSKRALMIEGVGGHNPCSGGVAAPHCSPLEVALYYSLYADVRSNLMWRHVLSDLRSWLKVPLR